MLKSIGRGFKPPYDYTDEQNINLIDFGFATKYMINNEHIKKTKVDIFRGNIMFASLSQLDFNITSRRDDLISLCYMVVYILNKGTIPGINMNLKEDTDDIYVHIK